MSEQETKQTPIGGGPTNTPDTIPTPETNLPDILPIIMECKLCGIKWQFLNADCVAEKSINHHYKSGECVKRQQDIIKFNRWHRNLFRQEFYEPATGPKTIWENPSRGSWTYF